MMPYFKKTGLLTFWIKLSNESFFSEGDVAEGPTLIEVDDIFVILVQTLFMKFLQPLTW
jgi:hypothetical protein